MKNKLQIFGGVVGAIVGFVAAILLLEFVGFGNRADPIASGLLALFAIGPIGAIAGLVLGTKLAMLVPQSEHAGSLARNSFKAFAALVVLCAAAGTAYYVYAVNTATPWLNPNAANPQLEFEIRLPANTALPASAGDVAFELQTDVNTMPGDSRPGQFRRDGDKPVVAGDVELAFRTASRMLLVRIKDQPDRLYRIGLTAKAPHTSELGPWLPQGDGSEIRYRAKWPGRD
ncbi:MAG: hypothetical protein ABJA75_27160 [Bradyrhizobium sp.]